MNEVETIAQQTERYWRLITQTVESQLPQLVAAAAVVVVGWIIAAILRGLVTRLLMGTNPLLQNFGPEAVASRLRVSERAAGLTGLVVYWSVLLLAFTIAANTAGFSTFSAWLQNLVGFLPTLLAGVLIIVLGYFLSRLIRELVASALATVGSPHGRVVGGVAQALVLVLAVLTGVEQVGIDVSILVTLTMIAIGGVVASFALAFALGGRDYLANLIGAYDLRREYRIGQQVQVAGHTGTIAAFTPTAVILVGADGRICIPAKVFQTEIVTVHETAASPGSPPGAP